MPIPTYDRYTDDLGQVWEVSYQTHSPYDEEGRPEPQFVTNFRFRKLNEPEWTTLPPWGEIEESAKITLCLFDEDEDGEIVRYWPVKSE